EVPHVDVEKIHFDIDGAGLAFKLFGRRTMRVIRREEFDAWLAMNVKGRGMEIREGIKVTDVRVDEDEVIVATDHGEFRAPVVIGADGSNGITRRAIFPHEPVYTARVLEIHAPTATQPSPKSGEIGGSREQTAFFEFFPVPNNIAGYV